MSDHDDTFSPRRRDFLQAAGAASAGLVLAAQRSQQAMAQDTASQLERNKAVALRFKKAQGTPEMPQVEREVLAPNYKRPRGGMLHLANNARDQGYPSTGAYLRGAFPDRVDVIEEVIAEGDKVGQVIAPEVADVGEYGDVVLKRLLDQPPVTEADRNKIVVARSKSSTPAKGDRAPDFKQRRPGFQNMREYGDAKGVGNERLVGALPDRRDTIHDFIAEGDKVWMQFQVRGTQTVNLYGLPPTGRRISVPEVGIARFAGGKWQEGWYFADELGALLQLGVPNLLTS